MNATPMKLTPKQIIPLALVGVVALAAVASIAGWYFYQVIQTSLMAGGTEYAVKLPPRAPQNVHDIPQCSGNAPNKWAGCSL